MDTDDQPLKCPPLCAGYTKFFTLTDPTRHTEMSGYPTLTWPQIVELAAHPMQEEKDYAWWVIPSTCNSRMARTKYEQLKNGEFWMLGADIDKGGLSLATVVKGLGAVLDPSTEYLIYATRSSTPQNKKWRVLMPTAGGIPPDAFHHLANLLNEALGIVLGVEMDPVTERVQQFLFVPNMGVHYEYFHCTGKPWGGTPSVARALELTKLTRQRMAADPARSLTRERAKERGPLLEEFNRRHDINTLLEHYGFIPDSRGENWHHPDQTSKSYGTTTRPDGMWLSSSDTVQRMLGRKGGDAFDVFVAMECGGDYARAYKAWAATLATELREQYPFMESFTVNGVEVKVGQ